MKLKVSSIHFERLWLGLCLMAAAAFMVFCPNSYLNSDMSSELVLAELLSREGRILSQNWFYSTELRVLNTQLITTPLFLFFDNWHLIRVLSTFLHWAVLLWSFSFLLSSVGLSRWFCLTATLLFLPYAADWWSIVVVGIYYIPHIAISFVALGLLCRLDSSRHPWLVWTAGCLLAFVAGLGGARQLVVLYAPLFGAAALQLLWGRTRRDLRSCLFSFVLLLSSLLGYLGNRRLLEKYHFESYDEFVFGWNLRGIKSIWDGLMSSLGSTWDNSWAATVQRCMGAAVALVLLWLLCCLLFRGKELGTEQRVLLLVFPAGMAVFAALYCFTDMTFVGRYFLPIYALALPLLGLAMEKKKGKWAALFIVAGLTLSAVAAYPVAWRRNESREQEEAAAVLVEQGYQWGMASFWNANVMTEYSDGELELWTYEVRPLTVYHWLQNVKHADGFPEERGFLVMNRKESFRLNAEPFYQTENLLLYGFENMFELRQMVSSWHNTYDEPDAYLINGCDEDGRRVLPPSAVSFGPYITLLPGSYKVSIRGDGLEHGSYDVCINDGTQMLPMENMTCSDTEVSYTIRVSETVYGAEFRIFNRSYGVLYIDEMSVDCLTSEY